MIFKETKNKYTKIPPRLHPASVGVVEEITEAVFTQFAKKYSEKRHAVVYDSKSDTTLLPDGQ